MATDADDQDFDDTLKSFELLTGLSAAPAVSVPSGNPFQLGPTPLEAFRSSETVVKQIFGTHCECGAERMLPSTVCNSTTAPGKVNQSHSKHTTSLEHGIINPTPFKHKVKGEKKTIVRESMLKNIGRCVHQNLAKQNSIPKQRHNSGTFLPVATTVAQLLKPSLSENNLTKCFANEESDDMLDFRLLVAQCSELTLSHSKTPSDGGPNFSQSSFKSLRQSTNLSGFQLNRSTGSSAHSRRSRRARQLKRCNSTSSLESDSSSSNSGVPFGIGPLVGPLGPSTSSTSSSSSTQPPNPQQQQSPSASSPSSSCSTQARLNNVMPCDITIDEMASYFETLVHIPKKMSSMAEMMYI
ncbi:AAEL009441-PA [Aedes aegypti]|uniref:Oxidative stress-responsive serine-rich protein 1 n=1 Tax=Aedes aegypti TaxID=7159 RepID=Q16VT3_AEDAE|nr:AAEL009441-PA [Aedes aegypti]